MLAHTRVKENGTETNSVQKLKQGVEQSGIYMGIWDDSDVIILSTLVTDAML